MRYQKFFFLGVIGLLAIAALLFLPPASAQNADDRTATMTQRSDQEITLDVINRIKHDYGYSMVFDNLNVETHNGNVILTGQARDARLVDQAVKAARDVPGVKSVQNKIKLLPVSLEDDRLRLRIIRRLANDDRLFMYFMGVQPSMNIIVDHGRVTLSGIVNTKVDRSVAESIVRQMPGVLNVDDELRVQ